MKKHLCKTIIIPDTACQQSLKHYNVDITKKGFKDISLIEVSTALQILALPKQYRLTQYQYI